MNTELMLLSAIGSPKGFESSVSGLNLTFIKHLAYPDHHSYVSASTRKEIISAFKQSGAKWLLTTEKDYAKLRLYPEFADILLILSISFVPDLLSINLIENLAIALKNRLEK
jgi:tetraacyldisaccharide-1-P 4'-kinase